MSYDEGLLRGQPRPRPIHQRVVRRLADALEPQLPPQWQLETDIDVMLAEDPLDYLSPDVVVFDVAVPLTTRPVPGSAILVAVEVVSRGSHREDRGSKPLAYAEAGIRHYWRVEGPASGALALAVHTNELDGAGEYKPTGVHDHVLTIDLPGLVRVDLTALG
ncbi:Uma2 family endonuclease [Kutzneria sp. 744]|uniref:Uma2 family endonuclease n=1 Tax=Kutzneria sp. (strain 744) TaxID=345341 RepID=UPI0018DDB951|nr:Uma2 family endonuclease [Kutzneria sp. 744]